jgi:hypothetical protein
MSVDRNGESTDGKLVGGITGKGWLPGQSGNPGGRRPLPQVMRERLDDLTPEAIEGIAVLARTADSESVRLAAWEYLLNRRFGRPTEKIQTEQVPITFTHPTDEQFERWARHLVEAEDAEKGDGRLGGGFHRAGAEVSRAERGIKPT